MQATETLLSVLGIDELRPFRTASNITGLSNEFVQNDMQQNLLIYVPYTLFYYKPPDALSPCSFQIFNHQFLRSIKTVQLLSMLV